MNNGDLHMPIHKQLHLEEDLRMCAGFVIQKSSMRNEVIRQVCLHLFEFI